MDFQRASAYILNRLERELSPRLYYHGLHHTLDVRAAALRLCATEGISDYETELVDLAALFHDAGLVTDRHLGHEEASCAMVRESLPEFGFHNEAIEVICGLIWATKIPQSPKTNLERILCDADLDYLGRDDFQTISESLFREFLAYGMDLNRYSWNRLQVSFIGAHTYFTETNRQDREPQKMEHLEKLVSIVLHYDKELEKKSAH